MLADLDKYPVSTRLSLNGTIIVGRDIAHAKIKERLDAGEPMPQYLKRPSNLLCRSRKKPEGLPSGSFGPTTAGRMDSYVDQFQEAGGSMIMIAKATEASKSLMLAKTWRLLSRINWWSCCYLGKEFN